MKLRITPRSLQHLARVKQFAPDMLTKSGMMVGLGETMGEVKTTLGDLRSHHVDLVTVGQYLRPSFKHLPIDRYYTPAEFAEIQRMGQDLDFRHVESGPLVRSSYHARRAHQSGSVQAGALGRSRQYQAPGKRLC